MFSSCEEVKFSSTNLPFLYFMGSPTTADEFLSFLGQSQEAGGMAPYALQFLPEQETPAQLTVYDRELPHCGSPGFQCSCADCSTADYCHTVKPRRSISSKHEFWSSL